ncbi:MAG TPA: glycoside hydrolase family 172 protein [Dongiaceae bacterium]|nr:glycoside hydrolase family 172 protein [Dongiaceae bacterium]
MNKGISPSAMAVLRLLFAVTPAAGFAQALFDVPDNVQSRWISFENPTGAKEAAGLANQGRKGSPSRNIRAGETATLAEIKGPGIIRRIWCTVSGDPRILRGMVLRIYWENQPIPSVEAPLQDFFGVPFARQVAFESALFSNPEGRSFNCYVPMPFRGSARIVVENQSPRETSLFFDVDYTLGDPLPRELCYFHSHYRRENPTQPKRDFQVLPQILGKGRFLGFNVGVRALGAYKEPVWFGEGEMKIYLDGDQGAPTLVGTGTEDLVGSAWGLGKFHHLYQGCLLTSKEDGVWGFYRYLVPDPVYFHAGIRVDLQQVSGARAQDILKRIEPKDYPELVATHRQFDPAGQRAIDSWLNFEAPQDVCATAYWYQTLPSPRWEPLEPYEDRMKDLAIMGTQKPDGG